MRGRLTAKIALCEKPYRLMALSVGAGRRRAHGRLAVHHGRMESVNDVTIFAETTARAQYKRFGIQQADRRSHVYLIGKTGVGKSTLLGLDLCNF